MSETKNEIEIPQFSRLKPGEWQNECTRILKYSVDFDKLDEKIGRERIGRERWNYARKHLEMQHRIIIADYDFSGKDMEGYNLSRCYIIRCNFIKSNLKDAIFKKCMIRNANFSAADLRGTNFDESDMISCTINRPKYSPKTSFNFSQWQSSTATPITHESIQKRMRESEIENIEMSPLVKVWAKLTKYGDSLFRLSMYSFFWNIFVGIVFFISGNINNKLFDKSGNNITFDEAVIMAFQKFINTTSIYNSTDRAMNVIFTFQTILGIAALGLALTVLAKKLIILK